MIQTHGLPFVSTSKDRLAEQMVQKVRDWVFDERIQFAPDAEFTLQSCMSGWWSKGKDKFAQSKIYGHYDHLAALVYLIRNVNTNNNVLPRLLGISHTDTFVDPSYNINQRSSTNTLKNIFKRKHK